MTSPSPGDIEAILAEQLADPGTGWSLGTFGALGEFTRDPEEPCDLSPAELRVVTARGGLALAPPEGLRLFAYELPSRDGRSWSQAVALCLPEAAAAMTRRAVLSELGPDRAALRPGDRDLPLFDMGLGCLQVDVCLRSAEPATLAALREGLGRPVLAPGHPLPPRLPALSPPRVFLGPLGRLEVYQPIPEPGGRSPEGPHSHVLPALLRHGRTHAATLPLPEGWIPCASFFPANPLRDALGRPRPFDREAHARFQALLRRFGDPVLLAVKDALAAALEAGQAPEDFPPPATRAERAVLRVALRQHACLEPRPERLAPWRAAFDRAEEGKETEEA